MNSEYVFGKNDVFSRVLISARVGFFLAVRDVKQANIWTTVLIIFVMSLTFLNIIVVRGILLGLVQGATQVAKQVHSGDIILSSLTEKPNIKDSGGIVSFIKSIPTVESVTSRYVTGATVQSGYKTRKNQQDLLETVNSSVAGIHPHSEDKTTGLSHYVIEGDYLLPDDYDKILLGAALVGKYTSQDSPVQPTLKDVGVGSKVQLLVNGHLREVTVKGFIKTKVDIIDTRIFMPASQLQTLMDRNDQNVNEIIIRVKPGFSVAATKNYLTNNNLQASVKIQTSEESKPQYVKDVEATFSILGDVVGTIALVVGGITIFIVIFVNAITRRKYIGILKGIGITSLAIEASYVMQAVFYSVCGICIAFVLSYGFLVPYFAANPINFPFSDGILYAPIGDIVLRAVIVFIATLFAGFVPAWIVVRQNTLDAIMGR